MAGQSDVDAAKRGARQLVECMIGFWKRNTADNLKQFEQKICNEVGRGIDVFVESEMPAAKNLIEKGIDTPNAGWASHLLRARQRTCHAYLPYLDIFKPAYGNGSADCGRAFGVTLRNIERDLHRLRDRTAAAQASLIEQRNSVHHQTLRRDVSAVQAQAKPASSATDKTRQFILDRLSPLRAALPIDPAESGSQPLVGLTLGQLNEILEGSGFQLAPAASDALLEHLRRLRCETDWQICADFVDAISRWPGNGR